MIIKDIKYIDIMSGHLFFSILGGSSSVGFGLGQEVVINTMSNGSLCAEIRDINNNSVSPQKEATEIWNSYAKNPFLSDKARQCHESGGSYILNSDYYAREGLEEVPSFLAHNMNSMFMVGLDGYTIAPHERVIVLSKKQKCVRLLRWLVRILS